MRRERVKSGGGDRGDARAKTALAWVSARTTIVTRRREGGGGGGGGADGSVTASAPGGGGDEYRGGECPRDVRVRWRGWSRLLQIYTREQMG